MELDETHKDEQKPFMFSEDVLHNVVRSYLNLQSVARFGQTCKVYEKRFIPGKIERFMPCFLKIEENYYRCTHALARFAQHENDKMFERLWRYDKEVRDKYIEILGSVEFLKR